MKGMVFTEFLEMVEDLFGWEMAEDIIDESELPSGGAYTAVGTYPYSEMVSMVQTLSQKTGVAIPDLLKTYGKHLFGRFAALYGSFFEGVTSTFEFLESIDQYIHVEVRKLYPDADLPEFNYEKPSEDELVMIYRSERPFADFAEGLISGCIEYFGEDVKVERENLPGKAGTSARFSLIRQKESIAA